jgi:uncharacterized protein (DUF58 family)
LKILKAMRWRVAQKDRIGAFVFNDSRIEEIRPQRSHATVMRILHAVVEQNHALSLHAGLRANPKIFNEVLRHVAISEFAPKSTSSLTLPAN